MEKVAIPTRGHRLRWGDNNLYPDVEPHKEASVLWTYLIACEDVQAQSFLSLLR
jgi:hypothetical protein